MGTLFIEYRSRIERYCTNVILWTDGLENLIKTILLGARWAKQLIKLMLWRITELKKTFPASISYWFLLSQTQFC